MLIFQHAANAATARSGQLRPDPPAPRLSAGWLNSRGHGLMAAASFADHQRFRSNARKAGDWQGLMVGLHEHPARVGLGSGGAVRGGVVPDQPGVVAGRLSAPPAGVENLPVRLGSAATTAPDGAGPVAGAASLAVRAQACVSSPALCRGRELCHPAGLLSAVRQPGSKRPAICPPMAFKSAPIAPAAHRYRPWHLGGLPGPAPAVCWQPLEKDWNPR
jgi:hypothetical protein